jgi:hypothetical protein
MTYRGGSVTSQDSQAAGIQPRVRLASVLARTVASGLLAAGALATVGPATASAMWRTVARSPTSASPFYICPQHPHRVSCASIRDPASGRDRRGSVAAGAITAGPAQETSPALYGTGMEGGYSPADLRSAYELPSASAGYGQTVAVVDAYDDPNAEHDLAEYRSEYEIPPCTSSEGCLRKVDQSGGQDYPEANMKWAEEISLDLDMVSAVCPDCHILLVEAHSDQEEDLAVAEDEAVKLGATEISDSFLGPESPSEASAYEHPGIPIAASGGDDGYGAEGVEAPAAYSSVIAVGGTSLRPEGERRGRRWAETAWSETGSRCSHEPKPSWQSDPGCAFRTTNDVSAVADPNTPVSVYDSYGTGSHPWLLFGGTSVSAPIVAGTMALANAYTRSFNGAHALYLEVENGLSAFNDITSGKNGTCGSYLCEAGVGYDGPTGLGSPRGAPEVPPPTAVTGAAEPLGPREATLEGTVNPHGAAISRCIFEYGPGGASGASALCEAQPGTGTTPVAVTAHVAGLEPGVAYRFRLSASYAGGVATGSEASLDTAPEAPSALAGAVSSITQSSVEFSATVDPEGGDVGECDFEYGPTTAYGSLAYCSTAPGSGDAPVAVSATASGLTADTLYHYRFLAGNSAGTTRGADRTFSTLPLAPAIAALAPSGLSATGATLNATIDPNGAPVSSCEFEFASAATILPCTPAPGSGEAPVAVSASVSGLAPATRYVYRVLAANAGGTVYGPIEELTTADGLLAPGVPGEPLAPAEPSDPTPAVTPSRLACARASGARPLLVDANGTFALTLRCHPGVPVRGTITLRTIAGAHAGRQSPGRVPSVLVTGPFALPASGSVTIVLRLSRQVRRLLAQARLLRAQTTLSTGPPSTPTTNVGIVVLRARRSRSLSAA